jgi:hypothetical protein
LTRPVAWTASSELAEEELVYMSTTLAVLGFTPTSDRFHRLRRGFTG